MPNKSFFGFTLSLMTILAGESNAAAQLAFDCNYLNQQPPGFYIHDNCTDSDILLIEACLNLAESDPDCLNDASNQQHLNDIDNSKQFHVGISCQNAGTQQNSNTSWCGDGNSKSSSIITITPPSLDNPWTYQSACESDYCSVLLHEIGHAYVNMTIGKNAAGADYSQRVAIHGENVGRREQGLCTRDFDALPSDDYQCCIPGGDGAICGDSVLVPYHKECCNTACTDYFNGDTHNCTACGLTCPTGQICDGANGCRCGPAPPSGPGGAWTYCDSQCCWCSGSHCL